MFVITGCSYIEVHSIHFTISGLKNIGSLYRGIRYVGFVVSGFPCSGICLLNFCVSCVS